MTYISGDFQAKCVKPELGASRNDKPMVRALMEIVDGEHKGKRVAYDGKLDENRIKYTRRDMLALGWQGKSVATFVEDVIKAALVVPIKVEVVTWNKPEGGVKQWESVRSIGVQATPLTALDDGKVKDVDSWFAEAAAGEERLPF